MLGYNHQQELNLVRELDDNQQKLAQHIIACMTLKEIQALAEKGHNLALSNEYKVSGNDWPSVLGAVLMAKCTYFSPDTNMTREQLLYLMKTTCDAAGYRLGEIAVPEIIKANQSRLPYFTKWLAKAIRCYAEITQKQKAAKEAAAKAKSS